MLIHDRTKPVGLSFHLIHTFLLFPINHCVFTPFLPFLSLHKICTCSKSHGQRESFAFSFMFHRTVSFPRNDVLVRCINKKRTIY